MKRLLLLVAALTAVVPAVVPAAPNAASTAFTRAANSPAGRPLFELQIAATSGTEAWKVTGQDVVPFYYEQGMAQFEGMELVHSSRNSLTRTAVGCAASLDVVYGACYDVREERVGVIPAAQMQQGFNHIGGIDIGQDVAGAPANGMVFAALETDPPRSRRGYAAYDLTTLALRGLLVEEIVHRYHSWVAIDPTGRWLIATEDDLDNPLRVYEVTRTATDPPAVGFVRRADLDVTKTTAIPNFQGCKFSNTTTLYCSNWAKRNSYFDMGTEIFRVDLSATVGTPGATATGALAFSFKAQPKYGITSNTPYGLETEDLAFWGGELHVQLRGEALGWVHVVHLGRV